jgi:sugar phosphate isomerase/epimerase
MGRDEPVTARIGLQLYTVRDLLGRDLAGTLRRVADLGFAGVETAFFADEVATATAARELRALGVEVFAAHTPLPLGAAAAAVLRAADALGASRIVWHGWPRDPRYGSLDGIRRLAAEFNEANAVAVAHGLAFAIHNHWWECEPVGETFAYRVLLAELDPAVGWELDAYWTAVAGLDPAATAAELGDRLGLLHLKDGPLRRHEPMVPLGEGMLDIPAVLAAAPGAEWAVVELDEVAGDPLAAVGRSREYLAGLGLATG